MVYHIPALLNESIDGLNIKPDGIYVDVTFGGGGHSMEILKRLKTGLMDHRADFLDLDRQRILLGREDHKIGV